MKATSKEPNLKAFQVLISESAMKNQFDEAFFFLNEMKKFSVTPDHFIYESLSLSLMKNGRIEEGLEYLKSLISQSTLNIYEYNSYISVLIDNNRIKEAYNLFSDLKKKNIEPNHFTFHELIANSMKIGDLEEVDRLFQEMRDFGLEPDTKLFKSLLEEKQITIKQK